MPSVSEQARTAKNLMGARGVEHVLLQRSEPYGDAGTRRTHRLASISRVLEPKRSPSTVHLLVLLVLLDV
jgi:hypothetical protein